MNFVAFKYFHEVVKAKSIRRAADRLHVAPSAVSRQLVQLEHRLGTPLLERTNIGVALTPAGMLVERYTVGMFRDLDQLQASIRDYRGLQQGEVKLCIMEGIIAGFLPRVITEFQLQYPEIRFTVISESSDRMIEALIRDEADIAVVYNARPRPEIEVIAEHAEPVMCLMAKHHPLAHRASITLAEICALPIALPTSDFGLRQLFERAVASRKLAGNVVLTANTLELTHKMARAGRVVTIGPALCAANDIQAGFLKAIPIAEAEFAVVRSMICVHRDRTLSYAASGFLKKISAEFENIGSIQYMQAS